MKNFIFALCGFLMMALMPLNVQASSVSELSQCEYVAPSVDVVQPDIQYVTFEIAPVNYFVLTAPQPILMIADSPTMQSVATANIATQGKHTILPERPFRYVYRSKYCTHYSYTAYSKLITPY